MNALKPPLLERARRNSSISLHLLSSQGRYLIVVNMELEKGIVTINWVKREAKSEQAHAWGVVVLLNERGLCNGSSASKRFEQGLDPSSELSSG